MIWFWRAVVLVWIVCGSITSSQAEESAFEQMTDAIASAVQSFGSLGAKGTQQTIGSAPTVPLVQPELSHFALCHCLMMQAKMTAIGQLIDEKTAALMKTREYLRQQGAGLKILRRGLDPQDNKQRAKVERVKKRYREKVEDFKTASLFTNSLVTHHNLVSADYQLGCVDKTYRDEDYQILVDVLGEVAKTSRY